MPFYLTFEQVFGEKNHYISIKKMLPTKQQKKFLDKIIQKFKLGEFSFCLRSNTYAIEKGKKRFIFMHILVAAILKNVSEKRELIIQEQNVFRDFYKNETEYKVNVRPCEQFYKDFVIDRIDVEPFTELEKEIKRAYEFCDDFCKNNADFYYAIDCFYGLKFHIYSISN